MEGMGMQLLTMAGYQLPELIAVVVALALLWTSARPGQARSKGLIGVGLMLFTVVCRFGMSVFQAWTISNSGREMAQLQQIFALMGAAGILLNLLFSVGLVLIVWGLCQATRPLAQISG